MVATHDGACIFSGDLKDGGLAVRSGGSCQRFRTRPRRGNGGEAATVTASAGDPTKPSQGAAQCRGRGGNDSDSEPTDVGTELQMPARQFDTLLRKGIGNSKAMT